MQIGPEARYLQVRPALRSATSEIRSLSLSSLPACQKTENPLFVQHPLGLCNKPYTLLRTAGDAPARIFQHLCNQTNQTSKLKRGNTHPSSSRIINVISPIAIPNPAGDQIPVPQPLLTVKKQTALLQSPVFHLHSRDRSS